MNEHGSLHQSASSHRCLNRRLPAPTRKMRKTLWAAAMVLMSILGATTRAEEIAVLTTDQCLGVQPLPPPRVLARWVGSRTEDVTLLTQNSVFAAASGQGPNGQVLV